MLWSLTPRPRCRVIVDNDFSGDPDDLFALVHQVLSPSADVVGVIGSHLAPGDTFDGSDRQAQNAADVARRLLGILSRSDIPVAQGSNGRLRPLGDDEETDAAQMILREADRASELPLLLTAGGGLTELARAWRLNPSIEERLTLVWIGGPEYPGRDAPPHSVGPEYNMNIDVPAAQVIFNESAIPIVQVPRDAYRQCIVTLAELAPALSQAGRVGDYLATSLEKVIRMNEEGGHGMGETYVMGDNPLVVLSSLQTPWQPDFASSTAIVRQTPYITDDGGYAELRVRHPREIRVCTQVDTRLMISDLVAKLHVLGGPRC